MHEQIPTVAAIVGDDHVSDSPAALAAHTDLGAFTGGVAPVLVVRPGSSREVRDLVVWANRTRTPLVPVSSSGMHRHGASSPSAGGAVLVDLTRLDRVLRVDRRNRMAVIEPGVTYPQVQTALAEHGMRVATPLQPRAGKSVVASLLEREPTVIPRHNHSLPEPLRDCGVVWGNGVTMFTGEAGAGPASLDEQWRSGLIQAEAKGPGQTDFYRLLTGAQGTMGIVTWASVKCDLVPVVHRYLHATSPRYEDLASLVRELCLQRLGDEIMVFNQWRLADVLGAGASAGWTLVAGFGGRARQAEHRMQVRIADAAAVAHTCGISLEEGLPGAPGGPSDRLVEGPLPGRPAPSRAEVFFLSPTSEVARLLDVMSRLAEGHGFAPHEVGVYIQPQHQGVTHHVEFAVPFEDADDDARARARRMVAAAGSELTAAGAYFSRPYGAWAGPVYNRDAAARDALRKVKAIFDPAGILNPGKLCFGAPAAPPAPAAKEAS